MALALGFTACDGYEEPNPAPQNNPQETIMGTDGIVTVANGEALTAGAASLSEVESVAVLEVVEVKDFPASSELQVVMQISKSADFSSATDVATSLVDGIVTVAAADWQAAHLTEFGKNPKAQQTYVRFALYEVIGTSVVRIGQTADTYYQSETTSLMVTPYPTDYFIDEAYYLVCSSDGMDVAKARVLDHVGDVYDNPVFTLKVDIEEAEAAAGWTWKILSESQLLYGVDAAATGELKGDLVVGGEAAVINQYGPFLISINMYELTYEVTSAVDNLWVVESGKVAAKSPMLYTMNFTEYKGYAVFTGVDGFQLKTDTNARKAKTYGPGETDGTIAVGATAMIPHDVTGPQWVVVNTAALTYSTTLIETIGIVGDAVGSWNDDVVLTPNDDYTQWSATVDLTTAGFKFRANAAWDINWGWDGDNGVVVSNAQVGDPGHFHVDEAGTYEVVFTPTALAKTPASVTFTKK